MNIQHFTNLKTKREFNRVYKQGKTSHALQFVLFYYYHPEEYKFSAVASKKVGKAVQRNLAKRLLRSHLINRIDLLKPGHYILVAKPALLEAQFNNVQKSFFKSLKRLNAVKQ